jgi:hypothetical protein
MKSLAILFLGWAFVMGSMVTAENAQAACSYQKCFSKCTKTKTGAGCAYGCGQKCTGA